MPAILNPGDHMGDGRAGLQSVPTNRNFIESLVSHFSGIIVYYIGPLMSYVYFEIFGSKRLDYLKRRWYDRGARMMWSGVRLPATLERAVPSEQGAISIMYPEDKRYGISFIRALP